jgi:hypothetical protein
MSPLSVPTSEMVSMLLPRWAEASMINRDHYWRHYTNSNTSLYLFYLDSFHNPSPHKLGSSTCLPNGIISVVYEHLKLTLHTSDCGLQEAHPSIPQISTHKNTISKLTPVKT